MTDEPSVVIVGAGLAGLCCAKRLAECGTSFRILEASDGVGGRVRTDLVDGFRLDRGFQIYLTAYPEGRRILDLDALDMKPFTRGAMVWAGGKFHHLVDPRADPIGAVGTFFNPIGSFRDKLRAIRLFWELDRGKLDAQIAKDERLTLDLLRWNGGFTRSIIDRFFRPFLGGVFLERELATSSRFFRFVARTFAEGPGAIPALGMQAIPDQLAAGLPRGSVSFGERIVHLGHREVTTDENRNFRCRAVVVATEGPMAAQLIGDPVADPGSNGTITLYYAADRAPLNEPILMLDGDGTGPVNSVVVMSNASPAYAPPERALISASVIGIPPDGPSELDRRARIQLTRWFGSQVATWTLLREYRIPHALPAQTAGKLDPWQRPVRLRPGLYVCGDHRDNGSIDGAMTSGFRAAQAAMADMAAQLT